MEHKITFIIEYSWDKWQIKNFWNVSAGTIGTNGTYGTSEYITDTEHKITCIIK